MKDDPFCIHVGKRVHRLVKSRLLKGVSGRGRCVACYARSVTSPTSKKRRVEGGHAVPNVTRACNVCKKLLCVTCFRNTSLFSHDVLKQHHSVVSVTNIR